MHNMQYGANPMPPLDEFVVRDTTPRRETISWAAFSASIQYDYEVFGKDVRISSKYKPKNADVKLYDFDADDGYKIVWVD